MNFLSKKGLFSLTKDLRNDKLPLMDYLKEAENFYKSIEPKIKAFVPEKNRFKRLNKDAELLLSKYPKPSHRPLLFGIPIGVKDIFRVSGFETKAGSKLPPKNFDGKEII